ncbi:bifunctional DNA primase/polymerase [Streptomyces noursei]
MPEPPTGEPMAGLNQLLDVALSYVNRGWGVIPLEVETKRPAADQNCVLTDPEAVRSMWTTPYNIGLAMRRSNLLVLDLGKNKNINGRRALHALSAHYDAPMPTTRTVLTPSGGTHLYFSAPPPNPPPQPPSPHTSPSTPATPTSSQPPAPSAHTPTEPPDQPSSTPSPTGSNTTSTTPPPDQTHPDQQQKQTTESGTGGRTTGGEADGPPPRTKADDRPGAISTVDRPAHGLTSRSQARRFGRTRTTTTATDPRGRSTETEQHALNTGQRPDDCRRPATTTSSGHQTADHDQPTSDGRATAGRPRPGRRPAAGRTPGSRRPPTVDGGAGAGHRRPPGRTPAGRTAAAQPPPDGRRCTAGWGWARATAAHRKQLARNDERRPAVDGGQAAGRQ